MLYLNKSHPEPMLAWFLYFNNRNDIPGIHALML